ncbi:universal stress protein [Thermodesulfobacteriota bacterium]
MFKKILYPTDFSDVSAKVIPYIKQLKEGGTKEVIVLHVLDAHLLEAAHGYLSSKSFDSFHSLRHEGILENLRRIEEELKEEGLEVKTIIKDGIPLREILKVEMEEDVLMIVIGSHGMSNLEEVFLGSVSEKVIRKSKKPVLVIKRACQGE